MNGLIMYVEYDTDGQRHVDALHVPAETLISALMLANSDEMMVGVEERDGYNETTFYCDNGTATYRLMFLDQDADAWHATLLSWEPRDG